MSRQFVGPVNTKLSMLEFAALKRRGEKIAMVTAYDAPGARLADAAGVDCILVGDSAAMTVLGRESTVSATMDEMLMLTRAVVRGARRAIVIADMPFGSYQVSDDDAVRNAILLIKAAGADAVKLEGAGPSSSRVAAIVDAGIPVMGHLGLTPQTATRLGGYKVQGRTAAQAERLRHDAVELERSGCFAIVLEAIPATAARRISEAVQRTNDWHRRRCRLRRAGARLARSTGPVRWARRPIREAVRERSVTTS